MKTLKSLAQRLKVEWQLTYAFGVEYSKLCLNSLARKRGKPEPYSVSKLWRKRGHKPVLVKQAGRLHIEFNALPKTVQAASIALLALFLFLLIFGAGFDWDGVTTELWGLLAEILVLGVVIFYINEKSQAAQIVARQHESISDFKYWKSDEAKFRILGAIRRLQHAGVWVVNLAGVTMSAVKLKEHDINKLDGSQLSGGHWSASIGVRTISDFEKVDFSDCSMRDVVFSQGDGMGFLGTRRHQRPQAFYTDCNFSECDLLGASFEQAKLAYTEEHPAETSEVVDEDEYGEPVYVQSHYGAFYNVELKDVSFKDAWLENVDFRDALDVEKADFSGARGVDSCLFSGDAIRRAVLNSSQVAS
ncbi:pentapeptide repeat-containing protein [Tritonibacter scottomollicae]|uniref:Pentapeptide repeat protein n=1 Tax=Tritonibacter scottomollicae TaxID=483013 RepID=A0A2T1AE48_TRISK|nr:pentapeptide repeat-containing protein [Tritonibacter scottomollicae]PRZ46869.1 pentapeptide repeat protein [Tritonibacter scottomollicae]